ncbi:MAG: glycosyltransferase family 4 protein [Planctomycetota bacterium]
MPDVDKILKIVHIITRLILGGAQENTLITCAQLAGRGHDVTLITGPAIGPEGALFDRVQRQNYKVITIDKLRRAICPLYDYLAYVQIKKLLERLRPDIVHTHSAKAGILGRFAAYALKDKAYRPAVVHTIHGLAFGSFQGRLLNRFYIAIEKAAAKRTDAFISVADAMTRQALAAGVGKPDMFTTAYSAIEEENFLNQLPTEQIAAFRGKYNIPGDAVVLVTIARLAHLKGHEFIIESADRLAKRFENCCWLFVGDGNLAKKIKQDVRKAGLENRVKFTGLLPPDRIPLAIQASDILLHCSLREGLARAIPQAMLCSKPAVSFNLDGAPEVINRSTGRLVEPGNIDHLTDACAELIADPQLRAKLGAAGEISVTKKFAPETMVDTIETIYQKLLEK